MVFRFGSFCYTYILHQYGMKNKEPTGGTNKSNGMSWIWMSVYLVNCFTIILIICLHIIKRRFWILCQRKKVNNFSKIHWIITRIVTSIYFFNEWNQFFNYNLFHKISIILYGQRSCHVSEPKKICFCCLKFNNELIYYWAVFGLCIQWWCSIFD